MRLHDFFEAKKKMSAKDDPCWDGYHMVGTKQKDGREVPNCVPGKKGVEEAFQNDESNLWYIYDKGDGRLKQKMIHNLQEPEARSMGYRDSIDGALRVANIIRSKFDPKKFVQKQGNQWVTVHPFGKKDNTSESDMSGIMHAARHYNRSFLFTVKTAEGDTKKYRVKAQSERVAREKFAKHYSMAKILDVKEED